MKKRRNDREYLLVGVTGGIGSGKSVVCGLFQELGRSVISADEVARNLTETDRHVKGSIRTTFGAEVFQSNGELDRKKLAEIVFSDGRLRKRLNKIIHPKVFDSLQQHIDSLSRQQQIPYVVIEAALIYETELNKDLDYVIVVDAQEETRILRVIQRDGNSRREILKRIRSQMQSNRKVQKADFVIYNNGQVSELHEKVKFVDLILTSILSSKNTSK